MLDLAFVCSVAIVTPPNPWFKYMCKSAWEIISIITKLLDPRVFYLLLPKIFLGV